MMMIKNEKGENRGIIAGEEEGLIVRKYGHEHVGALNQILRILQRIVTSWSMYNTYI